jgi:hypothetical protein
MLEFDLEAIDFQRIGRMGELVVELNLLSRGWHVGNFNATTANSAGWDLFAIRGKRSLRIRVKAKRPGVVAFRWSANREGVVFAGLDLAAGDDLVAAVSFSRKGPPDIYLLPTVVVERELAVNHAAWVSGPKRGGGVRKDTAMRHLYLDARPDLGPAHGYLSTWAGYRNAWPAS